MCRMRTLLRAGTFSSDRPLSLSRSRLCAVFRLAHARLLAPVAVTDAPNTTTEGDGQH